MDNLANSKSESSVSVASAALSWSSQWQPCNLNCDDCLSLQQILQGFAAPITEEHAFAIAYECMRTLIRILSHNVVKEEKSETTATTTTVYSLKDLRKVDAAEDILIHREGRVHEKTFLRLSSTGNDQHHRFSVIRKPSGSSEAVEEWPTDQEISEEEIIDSVGVVIFNALEYGLGGHEERNLTPGMASLLGLMTNTAESTEDEESVSSAMSLSAITSCTANQYPTRKHSSSTSSASSRFNSGDTDDEGIEKDHDDESELCQKSGVPNDEILVTKIRVKGFGKCVKKVISACANHLSTPSEAEGHFRAVCRALISECLELSKFLEKARLKDKEHSEEIHKLALKDWANLWIQTMNELRQGVKLKKTNYTKTPIEFELTPYEILMDDIRSRRYKLNKVMVDGEIPPKVKKDAHDIILEFIRSRPPLRPVSERKLKPKQKYVTPQEKLMQSIRSQDPRERLRKTGGPPEPKNVILESCRDVPCVVIESPKNDTTSSQPNRIDDQQTTPASSQASKKLIVPDPKLSCFEVDTSSDENDDEANADAMPFNQNSRNVTIVNCTSSSIHTEVTSVRPRSNLIRIRGNCSQPDQRRKSVQFDDENVGDVRVTSMRRSRSSPKIIRRHSMYSSRSSSNLSNGHFHISPTVVEEKEEPSPSSSNSLINSERWSNALKSMDLTLSEVVHIRTVLAKADLESLTIDSSLKQDLERSKVCFICMKVRFGMFNWSYACQLCHHSVCSGCLTKMKIPSEHFANIPVYALSSHLLEESSLLVPSSDSQRRNSSSTSRRSFSIFGSSISNSSNHTKEDDNVFPEQSKGTRVKLRRSNTISHKRDNETQLTRTSQINVCLDCKEMIMEIVRFQRTARRAQFTKSLCLN